MHYIVNKIDYAVLVLKIAESKCLDYSGVKPQIVQSVEAPKDWLGDSHAFSF